MISNAQFRQAAHQASAIQTDSAYIRHAVLATYPVDPRDVVVAAPSVDPVFSPDRRSRGQALASNLGVSRGYIVAVGGARRRGLPVAVEAWAQARAHGATEELVVVGSEIPSPRPGLFAAGRVPDEQWADLLAGATALCYPTRYEGFGMPALEAAASGVPADAGLYTSENESFGLSILETLFFGKPVVAFRIGGIPEVLGDAPEWCEGTTVTPIADGLQRLLADPVRQDQRRQAGLARAASSPTWADAARVLLETYARVAS